MELRPFEELGQHVATQQDDWLADAPADEGARMDVAEAAARTKPALWPWLPLGLSLACVLGAAFVVWRLDRAALTFAAGDPLRESAAGDWLSAPPGKPLIVSFSDGTRITLQPGARGRVTSLRRSGADWVLESGNARFDVVPRPGNEWRVLMGPFKVDVVGTTFEIAWHPEREELSLGLHHGRVVVAGCGLGAGQHVEAGQRLRASCPTRTFSVAPLVESAPPAHEPHAVVTPLEALPPAKVETREVPDTAPPAAASPAAVASASPQTATWQELARRGHFDRAYARVEAEFEVEGERGSLEEVLLLADAARLSAHVAQARSAYRTARRRFPGTPESARAAFHLGQMDTQSGALEAAARWFDAYLSERPDSGLAEAALGRLIEIRSQQGKTKLAAQAAASYLERYPHGAHADRARDVLRVPLAAQ